MMTICSSLPDFIYPHDSYVLRGESYLSDAQVECEVFHYHIIPTGQLFYMHRNKNPMINTCIMSRCW